MQAVMLEEGKRRSRIPACILRETSFYEYGHDRLATGNLSTALLPRIPLRGKFFESCDLQTCLDPAKHKPVVPIADWVRNTNNMGSDPCIGLAAIAPRIKRMGFRILDTTDAARAQLCSGRGCDLPTCV